jgi:hypothetical protein
LLRLCRNATIWQIERQSARMRLWSIHPKYLDSKGLVALWREGLLALAVLKGETTGYRRHPQLRRFLAEKDPVQAIKNYLRFVHVESLERGYHFDATKIEKRKRVSQIGVTVGQLQYELEHLKRKLIIRDHARYQKIARIKNPASHPLFRIRRGVVEEWESGNWALPNKK